MNIYYFIHNQLNFISQNNTIFVLFITFFPDKKAYIFCLQFLIFIRMIKFHFLDRQFGQHFILPQIEVSII